MTDRKYSILAHGLTAGYGTGRRQHAVIDDAEVSLSPGDFAVMVGANGAGKSTLLRTLAGIQPRLGGELFLDGNVPESMSRTELARTVAMVFTERTGAGGLTLREFVSLGRQPHTGFLGRMSADDRRIVDEAIGECGITSLADRFMARVSDGERQKAMIARALAQQTPIIMLDEPTSFLDVASRIETINTLSSLARDTGRTILLSTHDIAPALRAANRVIVLDKGTAQGSCTAKTYGINTPALTCVLDNVFRDRGIIFDPDTRDFLAR